MASDKPTGSNIQHTSPAEHNTSAVPGTVVVNADGVAVADAGGVAVVDGDGAAVADEDAMPIAMSITRDPCCLSSGAWRRGPAIPLR